MKKLVKVLLAVLLSLTFFGCQQQPKTKEVKIGVAIYQFNGNFMTLYRNDIQKYFDDLNAKDSSVHYTVEIVDGANDVNTQTEQVRTFISKGVDALIVNLVQTTSDALAKEIVNSGIPCVFINREIADFNYGDKTCYVGADARDSGTYQGQIIYNVPNHGDLNGDGTVSYIMIMGDPENTDAQYRTEFSIKYLTDNCVIVQNLFKQTGNWDQAQGQELVGNALATHGDKIEVVFCNNDGMALGAYEAIKAAGRTVGTDIYLVGVDALPECCEMVKAGTMTGTVLNDDKGQATACCDTVLQLLAGQAPAKKVNYVPYVMVTKDNADDYLK